VKKHSLPEDLVPKSFIDQFGSRIKFVLAGWDRMRFHASLRPLFSPKWMRTYLLAAKVRLTDFKDHAQDLTERILSEAKNIAQAAQRPYHYLPSSKISKEDFVEKIARQDQICSGLITVLGALEPCMVMTVRGCRDRRWLAPVLENRKCLHLYFYYEDPMMGRCHLRLQTWYPFSVDVCLNGRLWLAKQLDAVGSAYQRADNCFLDLADPLRAQEFADAQHQTNWLEFLNKLLAQAHPLQQEICRPFPSLAYYWAVTQSEYATDLVFEDPKELAKIYPAFVLHGICTFQSPQIMRFLGHRVPTTTGQVDRRFRGEARSDRLSRHEGVCIKHVASNNGLKAYDKMAQLLRVENTINHPEAFTIYRKEPEPVEPKPLVLPPGSPQPPESAQRPPPSLKSQITSCVAPDKPQRPWKPLRRTVTDIPRRAQVSRAANRRYLEALASTHVGTPLGELVASICQSLTRDGHRYRGLEPLGRDSQLLRALSRGEWAIAGVRNRDLQTLLYPADPPNQKEARRRSAAIGRKLRLLRAHGLIQKVPRTHRYQITPAGRKILTAILAALQASTEKLTQAMAA
jgi:hypothetical protein